MSPRDHWSRPPSVAPVLASGISHKSAGSFCFAAPPPPFSFGALFPREFALPAFSQSPCHHASSLFLPEPPAFPSQSPSSQFPCCQSQSLPLSQLSPPFLLSPYQL